jgi:hypothetical protein
LYSFTIQQKKIVHKSQDNNQHSYAQAATSFLNAEESKLEVLEELSTSMKKIARASMIHARAMNRIASIKEVAERRRANRHKFYRKNMPSASE